MSIKGEMRRKTRSKRTKRADIRGQPSTYTASHGGGSKERYTETETEKSQEAKGSWNNLRKTSKKEAKLRPGTNN